MTPATYDVRCPVCLLAQTVPKDIRTDASLNCARCERRFDFANALPVKASPAPDVVESPTPDDVVGRRGRVLAIGIPAALAFVAFAHSVTRDLDGPQFVLSFFFFGLVLLMCANVVRWNYADSFVPSVLAAGAVAAVAALRFIQGVQAGMEDFELMFIVGAIGFATFFVRLVNRDGNKSKFTFFGHCGGCGSGSCGSSCGGGCGGCG